MYSIKLAQKLHNEFLYDKHTQKQIKYKTPETQRIKERKVRPSNGWNSAYHFRTSCCKLVMYELEEDW